LSVTCKNRSLLRVRKKVVRKLKEN